MANEINNNYKKQPTTNTQKTEDNKNKPLTKEEIAKAAYEGSIFEAAEKIHKTVTKDIPDYSVAAGIPAKVIKKYDFEKSEWVKVK